MKRTIIVTDLTRFKNPEKVCIAGIDLTNGECLRPMPYLESSECRRLNLLPGAILKGDFTESSNREGPHQEDYLYSNLTFDGPSTSSQFWSALNFGLFNSVEEGFEITFQDNQKHIPEGHHISRSIITISTFPDNVEIVGDSYNPGKIKLNFTDQSGREFRYIPITDLGFHDYAIQHHKKDDLGTLNSWLRTQEEFFLRLGLSRVFTVPDGRRGYWLQANGIYTFPEFYEAIRCYV